MVDDDKNKVAPRIKRVRFSDGGVFETNASSASEYLFNPVFMVYVLLVLVLYAAMMQPGHDTGLDLPAHLVLWSSVFMSSLMWMALGAWFSLLLVDLGIAKAVFTPIVFGPAMVMNIFLMEYVLLKLGSSLEETFFLSLMDTIVRNVLIFVCLDIIHGRFVAPAHPTVIAARKAAETTSVDPAPVSVALLQQNKPVSVGTASETVQKVEGQGLRAAPLRRKFPMIEISRERFDPASIVSIRSEDHYLQLQLATGIVMVRGKLSETIKLLDDSLGIQINRSVWLAFSAIESVDDSSSGYTEVHSKDGSTFRVSKARKLVFKYNYERFQAMNSAA